MGFVERWNEALRDEQDFDGDVHVSVYLGHMECPPLDYPRKPYLTLISGMNSNVAFPPTPLFPIYPSCVSTLEVWVPVLHVMLPSSYKYS
jgi:hypothetical protein